MLRHWIPEDKLDFKELCKNPHPSALYIIEKNMDKINYFECLSENPNAVYILEENQDKINWRFLSLNPNAVDLLEKNVDKINWDNLSLNPNAISIIHLLTFQMPTQRVGIFECY